MKNEKLKKTNKLLLRTKKLEMIIVYIFIKELKKQTTLSKKFHFYLFLLQNYLGNQNKMPIEVMLMILKFFLKKVFYFLFVQLAFTAIKLSIKAGQLGLKAYQEYKKQQGIKEDRRLKRLAILNGSVPQDSSVGSLFQVNDYELMGGFYSGVTQARKIHNLKCFDNFLFPGDYVEGIGPNGRGTWKDSSGNTYTGEFRCGKVNEESHFSKPHRCVAV